MQERPDVQIHESSVYQFGLEHDNCVGNTISSLCSTLSGQDFELPSMYYALRGMEVKDMLRTYAKHVKKRPERKDNIRKAIHRLDQQTFMKFLGKIETLGRGYPQTSLISMMLEECHIEKKKGGMLQILEAANSGHELAVSFELPEYETPDGRSRWHMAHIGFNPDGVLVRHSDGGKEVHEGIALAIDKSAAYLNNKARTWNFVAIRKRDF